MKSHTAPHTVDVPPVLQGAPNFRDLGGVRNAEGRQVRRGRVYRSEVLAWVSDGDVAALSALGIGTVFDLRNPTERAATPTPWPRQGDAVSVQAMPHELAVPGADMRQFVQRLREASLDVQQVLGMMHGTYSAMPAHFGTALQRLFTTLALDVRDARHAAALVHCTAGKDRTGFVCAMLLLALDVPADRVMADYLATARYYTVERLMLQMEKIAGQPLDPAMALGLAELAQVKAAYLQASLDAITRGWGSVPAYLHAEAGLDPALKAALKARLLE